MLFGMDCLFIVSFFVLTFLIGLPFLTLVPSTHFRNKFLISPILGYGLAAFLATVLYKYQISHLELYRLLCGYALLTLFVAIYKRQYFLNLIIHNSKTIGWFFLFFFFALTMILIPYWLGGLQFSAFQAWIHDNFSYIGAALTYSNENFRDVNQSSGELFLHSPISVFGAIELYRRPTVEHLYGLVSAVKSHEMYRFGYLFLGMLVTNGILAATFLITNVFKCTIVRAMLVSVAIFVGFWGQVYIDFSAWSMTGAMPLLLTAVAYVIVAARNIQTNDLPPLTLVQLFPLSCLIGFALYFYPENTIFHLPALLAIMAAINFIGLKIRKSKVSFISTAKILCAILIGLAFSVFYFRGTISHFIWAAGFTAQNIMTEAVYGEYLQPFFGQANWFRPLLQNAVNYSAVTVHAEDPHVVLKYLLSQVFVEHHLALVYYTFVDGLYSFLGMYFVTPLASVSQSLQEYWRMALLAVLIVFGCLNYRSYKTAIVQYRGLFIFAGVLCGMLLFFLLMARPYAMARGLYFVGPYCVIAFFAPFFLSDKTFTLKNLFFIAVIVSQVVFGFARIERVAEHQFPVYGLPYTMARTFYFVEGKTQYDWNLSRFDTQLKDCQRIYVDVPNGWQEYAVTLYLYSKHANFVKKAPVKTSYWAVETIGFQKMKGDENCAMRVLRKQLADKTEFNELELEKLD